jgi:hypothetical protein
MQKLVACLLLVALLAGAVIGTFLFYILYTACFDQVMFSRPNLAHLGKISGLKNTFFFVN